MNTHLPDPLSTDVFTHWLHEQILQLSMNALSKGVLTCTACADSTSGEYVIEYQGETFRYSPPEAYAFLKFVVEQHQDKSARTPLH